MFYKKYHVFYVPTGETFVKNFTFDQTPYIYDEGVPGRQALELVNRWNAQNATSGFTYWLE